MATRTIHTGLYGTEAFHIVDAVWNEVLEMYGNKRGTQRARSVMRTAAKRADDNELVFECESLYRCYGGKPAFSNWNDQRVLDHIAWELKLRVANKATAKGLDFKQEWKRNNLSSFMFSNRHEVIISKLYFIYDTLRGRKTEKRYPAKYAAELAAMPLDPIMTEMKIAQKEEIKKIEEALTMTIRKLNDECYAAKERMRIEICNKYNKLIDDARAETAKKIEALKAEMDNFGNAAALLLGK